MKITPAECGLPGRAQGRPALMAAYRAARKDDPP
jgi:hypothetical protein